MGTVGPRRATSAESSGGQQSGTLFGMTDYGYLRTSRQQQEGAVGMDPDSQTRALEAVGVAPSDVYRDLGLSGTTASMSRAGWRVLQDRLRPGDTVVVVELARIGRRWTEAVNTIRRLRGEGVRFRSLAEGESTWMRYLEANEDSPDRFVGELLLQVAAWAAAQELEAIRRRNEGGARPRTGKTLGRPWAGPEALRQLAAQQRLGGASYGEIARNLNVGRSTVRSWLRRAGVP